MGPGAARGPDCHPPHTHTSPKCRTCRLLSCPHAREPHTVLWPPAGGLGAPGAVPLGARGPACRAADWLSSTGGSRATPRSGGGGPSGLAWPIGGRVVCLMKPACAFADTHGEGISLGWARGPCSVALGSWPQPLPAGHEGQLAHGPVGAAPGAGGWQGGLGPPELQLDPGGCVRAPAMVDGQAGQREPGGPGDTLPLEPLPAPGVRGPGIPQTTVLLGWGRP